LTGSATEPGADAGATPESRVERYVADAARDADTAALAKAGRETAGIVRGLGFGEQLCAIASVYPFLRAGKLSPSAVQRRFGAELGQLARELTQISELSLPGQWRPGEQLPPAQAEALRRMLLAVVNDFRVVFIRLAAQLVDLRQAKDAPAEQKTALARDTREIFAPLASRLGVWQIKWELEDFAFRYLQPDDYRRIARQLRERRTQRESYIESAKRELQALLEEADIRAEISGRPKHIYSIWRKMKRKEKGLDELYDVLAVRIIVDTVKDCYAALGVVHNRWPYIREEFDDYIANPKGNNYRSLHTAVFGPGGKPLEIQIRTQEMHRHAELGVAAHWRYKEGGPGGSGFEDKITWLRQMLDPESGPADGLDMLDNIHEGLFDDRVYAVTPRGDIVDLPAGATPLDFAYHVHTQIGHCCRGAKVDGRIVPLTYRINNGDRIEIITGPQPQPSRDWLVPRLGFLASPRNRTKVRTWFRQQDREQNRKQGREMIERELQRLHVRDLAIGDLAAKLGYDDVDALCVALGVGDTTTASVVNAAQQLLKPQEPEPPPKRARRHKPSGGGGVRVEGVGSMMSQFARCCNPVPPEQIMGYITVGRGISIHRSDCGSFLRLKETHPERVLEVSWGGREDARYPVELHVDAFDRTGLLRDITAVISDEDIRILAVESRVDDKSMRAVVTLRLEVADLETLSRVLSKLEQVPNVSGVRRDS
jgi:GTP pyrophosphokinase